MLVRRRAAGAPVNAQVVVLAAGRGTRLARPRPKPMAEIAPGRSILAHQLEHVLGVFGDAARVTVVVGFKFELIMEAFPDVVYVYNEAFDETNTSKSLLKGLRASHDGPVVWMNGDVVFDADLLHRLVPVLAADETAVCVNTEPVGEEEVKYTLGDDGCVAELSKTVAGGLGEAVGVNVVSSRDKAVLVRCLEECDDGDYFERAIELAIVRHGVRVRPVDISDLFAVEVDVEGDLERARAGVNVR